MDIHEMTGYRDGRVLIWNCEICGRIVAVYEAGTVNATVLVMEQGDPTASHRGGTSIGSVGGLTIGAVLVNETERQFKMEYWDGKSWVNMNESDRSDPFAEWAESADFSLLDDDNGQSPISGG